MKTRPLAPLATVLVLFALGTLGTPTAVRAQSATVLAQPVGPQIESPRLLALWQELQAGNAAALDSFWLEIKGKAPLVEPNPADQTKVRVTFLFKGSASTRAIFLDGGLPPRTIENGNLPSSVVPEKEFALLPGTNLWYRTERIPSDARFGYDFGVLNGSASAPSYVLDTLNSRQIRSASRFARQGISVLELPNAPPVPWIQQDPSVPQGKLVRQYLKSQTLKATRGFTVYTPPGYDPAGSAYGLLVVFDAEWYGDPQQVATPVTLDNLLAKRQIAPLVAVMVENSTGNVDRLRDLSNSPAFADFLAEELIPWVRQNYHVSADPARTIVGGSSHGGLMSSYCGLRHPEVFGNILSQSGSYWWWQGFPTVNPPPLETETGWLTRQFVTTPKLPLRFYMSVGRFELWLNNDSPFIFDYLLENRRLRDVLEAKGYPVTYEEINGAHDPLNWRSTLPHGLMALAGPAAPAPARAPEARRAASSWEAALPPVQNNPAVVSSRGFLLVLDRRVHCKNRAISFPKR